MNALLRPLQSLARVPSRMAIPAAGAAMIVALSGCVVAPPPGPILSRLAPNQPGAADSAHPLSPEEQKRYAEIDKQVIREQNEAIAADAWARYYAPTYYSAPVTFGGYYGGWNSGWGMSYYSPGYYPGWWW
ncbi:hypothetical protein [Trinickia sp. NRRL B-1857]|uniref:hypothetical protein n=1 Tax=Trinickia sp. NRRL B-1857 TaxID=3162879 RepID=UPI003D2C4504